MRAWVLAIPLVLAFAAPARADDPDQTYLTGIQSAGITYSNENAIILYGKGAREEMRGGTSFMETVTNVTKDYQKLPRMAADKLVASAVLAYCPEFQSQMFNERLNQPRVQDNGR